MADLMIFLDTFWINYMVIPLNRYNVLLLILQDASDPLLDLVNDRYLTEMKRNGTSQ